ncbi:MAG: polysaccharide deacetylase family protein [Thermomicrobiales bacterium]
MYHSISEGLCPWELAVSPGVFAGQLEILTKHASVMSLSDMLAGLDRGMLPERCVAITFDDGYADNLEAAKPILEQFECPATVFVVAGLVGSQQPFWWDELAHLTLTPCELPKVVRLMIDGRPFSFPLGDDAVIDRSPSGDGSWRFHEPPPTGRHRLLQAVWERLQLASGEIRRQALDELRRQAQLDDARALDRRIMDANKVARLSEGGLIEIGAHTMTHPILARLPVANQIDEIKQSKTTLEQITGKPVSDFSYPHGGRADYSQATVQAVRDAGFRSSCTTIEDWLRPNVDRYQLPRIHVPPASGTDFERLLSYWL